MRAKIKTAKLGSLEYKLCAAAAKGDLKSVRSLIEKGADVHTLASIDSTAVAYPPLWQAVIGNPKTRIGLNENSYLIGPQHVEVLKELLKAGADTSYVDKDKDTVHCIIQQLLVFPKTAALRREMLALIELHGGKASYGKDGPALLGIALREKDAASVRRLAAANVAFQHDIDIAREAINANSPEILQALVDGGLDVNQSYENGETIFDHAQRRNPELSQILRNAGASPGKLREFDPSKALPAMRRIHENYLRRPAAFDQALARVAALCGTKPLDDPRQLYNETKGAKGVALIPKPKEGGQRLAVELAEDLYTNGMTLLHSHGFSNLDWRKKYMVLYASNDKAALIDGIMPFDTEYYEIEDVQNALRRLDSIQTSILIAALDGIELVFTTPIADQRKLEVQVKTLAKSFRGTTYKARKYSGGRPTLIIPDVGEGMFV